MMQNNEQPVISGAISNDEMIASQIRRILNKAYDYRGQYERELTRLLGCTVHVSVAVHPQKETHENVKSALNDSDWKISTKGRWNWITYSKGETYRDVSVFVDRGKGADDGLPV